MGEEKGKINDWGIRWERRVRVRVWGEGRREGWGEDRWVGWR